MTSISVIIPLFNKEKDIVKTLNSVCKQTYNDFEIIIVDDGSTDLSVEKIKIINDNRISIFSKNNEGVSIARNFGVEKAKSNFVAFLDADDYWHPNHLEKLLFLIRTYPNNDWFATSYEKKRTNVLITPMVSPIFEKGENWSGVVGDFFENSLIDCLACASSVCMKTDFFKSLNGFNSQTTHAEDIDLWIRAALFSPLVFSNEITARHNLEASNRSSKKLLKERRYVDFNKFNKEENKNSSLKKYLDLNRYSLAIIYKLHGDTHSFKNIISNVEIKNLNKKQQFLLKQHRYILRLLFVFQELLEKLGFRLSSF
jgi:glycosyltransferase involved in cell wall biosynthesis